jgi:hypothetical protein
MAFELHDASVERDPAVHGSEETECALASDVGGLDRRAILQHSQKGKNRTLREIGMLQETSSVTNHLAELEFYGLEMWIDPLSAARLQGTEQSIAPPVMIRLRLGHCDMSIRFPVAGKSNKSAAPRVDRGRPNYLTRR